jgi:hypothetical protein
MTLDSFCFAAIDLAALNIVGHCYKEKPLNVQDILDCLYAIIQQRSSGICCQRQIDLLQW